MVQHHIVPMHFFLIWLKSSRKGSSAEEQDEHVLYIAQIYIRSISGYAANSIETVYDKNPATIEGLRRIVNIAAIRISEETVRKDFFDELKNVH